MHKQQLGRACKAGSCCSCIANAVQPANMLLAILSVPAPASCWPLKPAAQHITPASCVQFACGLLQSTCHCLLKFMQAPGAIHSVSIFRPKSWFEPEGKGPFAGSAHLHGVIDGQPCCHHATWGVDVHGYLQQAIHRTVNPPFVNQFLYQSTPVTC